MLTDAKRRVLYAGFMVFFVLCTAVILFFASGYRYDWAHRGIYRTGLLVLDVTPRPDTVVIDGKSRPAVGDPIRLTQVTPGVHSVRLEKSGYFAWEGVMTAYPGSATTFSHVRLFRQQTETTLVDSVAQFYPSHSGTSAAVVTASPAPALILVNLKNGSTTTVIERLTGTVDAVLWNAQDTTMLLRKTENGVQRIMTVSPTGVLTVLPNILFADDSIRWSTRNQSHLLLRHGTTLTDFDLTTMVSVTLATDVLDWSEVGNTLYTVQANGNLVTVHPQGSAEADAIIARLTFTHPFFVTPSPDNTLTILDHDSHRLALVPAVTTQTEARFFDDVTQAVWSRDRRHLVFGSEHELSTLDVGTHDPVLLLRSTEPDQGVWWIDDLPYLLLHQGNAFLIIDQSGRSNPITLSARNAGAAQGVVDQTGESASIFVNGILITLLF